MNPTLRAILWVGRLGLSLPKTICSTAMIPNSNKREFKGFGSDPCSNTGSNCQNVSTGYKSKPPTGKQGRLDWKQGTFKYCDNETLTEVINDISIRVMQEPVMKPGVPIAFKENSAWFECTAVVGWTEPKRDEKTGAIVEEGSIFVSFPSTALTRLYAVGGFENIWNMFNILDTFYGWKITRHDAALDDYDKSLNAAALKKALIAGNHSGFQNKQIIWDFKKAWTFTLGSRQSDEVVRIYNKDEESGGLIKSFRMEREYKDEKAQKAHDDLMNIPWQKWDTLGSELLISQAIGKTKFIDRTGNPDAKYLQQIPVLPFWAEWTENIVPTGYSKTRVEHSLNRKLIWIKRQVTKTVAMIEKALGIGAARRWLNKEVKWAEKNLSQQQENYANEWRKDVLASKRGEPVGSDIWNFAGIASGGVEVELPTHMQVSWGMGIWEAIQDELTEEFG